MKVEFEDVLLKVRINVNNGSIYTFINTCCALLHVSEWEQISLGVFFLSLSQPVVQVFFTGQKNHFIIIQLCAVAINHFLNMMIQNSSYIVLYWGGEVGSKTLAVSSWVIQSWYTVSDKQLFSPCRESLREIKLFFKKLERETFQSLCWPLEDIRQVMK